MSDEHWATLSIYDHRKTLYRNSLILFDRVVIPIPKAPVGTLHQDEIDALDADASYLENEGAAVRFEWDADEFYEWQKKTAEHEGIEAEALARQLANDPPFATRLQLSEKYNRLASSLRPAGVDSVIAVPVYGSRARYNAVSKTLETAEQVTLEIVLKQMPLPSRDVPLESIIVLRNDPQFRDSMNQLKNWRDRIASELMLRNDETIIRKAEKELEDMVKRYKEAMKKAKVKKVGTIVVSLMAIGATLAAGVHPLVLTMAKLGSPLFALRELKKPCWKDVAEKQCAPAGVIYMASHVNA